MFHATPFAPRWIAALAIALAAAPLHAASTVVPLTVTGPAIPGADGDTLDIRVSHDGTRELFLTRASNLVPGTAAGRTHLILREGNTLTRLAAGIGGAAPNGDVLAIAISGDGAYAAFTSRASNLVPGDSGDSIDLFRLDIDSGAITRFTLGVGQVLGASDSIDLNTSGSRACVATRALLHVDDTDNLHDAYLLNFDPPLRTRMSGAPGNANANRGIVGACRFAADDAGGDSTVVFASPATNLVAGDTNAAADIFVRTTGGNPLRLSLGPDNVQTSGGDNLEPWLVRHAGAQTLVWVSCATNLVDEDTNEACDVFRRNLASGAISRLSRTTNGQLDGPSDQLRVSHDGRLIVFRARAGDIAAPGAQRPNVVLAAFQGTSAPEVFDIADAGVGETLLPVAVARTNAEDYHVAFLGTAADSGARPRTVVQNGFTQRVTPHPGGFGSSSPQLRTVGTATALRRPVPNGDVLGVALSGDGRRVAFYSLATNLGTTGRAPNAGEVFVLDLGSAVPTLVSMPDAEGFGGATVGDTRAPAIDLHGNRIAFVADLLLGADNRRGTSIYLWTRDATPQLQLVSLDENGESARGDSSEPSMDDAGSLLVYSADGRFIVGDDFGQRDVYLRDLDAGSTVRLSESRFGGRGDGDSFDPRIDAAGRIVTFCSRANDLVANDTNPGADLFVADLDTGTLKLLLPGNGDTCHTALSASGDIALVAGTFIGTRDEASPGGFGPTELGLQPALDERAVFAAGIEVLAPGVGGVDGLVRIGKRGDLETDVVRIAPSTTPATALAGKQGHLALSRDGRTLFVTSRAALDAAQSALPAMRNLYRNLPRHVFFDGLED